MRQLARVKVPPLTEQAPRLILLATRERVANVGEVVTELAKAERQIEHPDVDGQSQSQAVMRGQQVQRRCRQRRRQDRDAPDDDRMPLAASVEIPPSPANPRDQRIVNPVVTRQRPELFGQQREEDGEEAHRPR